MEAAAGRVAELAARIGSDCKDLSEAVASLSRHSAALLSAPTPPAGIATSSAPPPADVDAKGLADKYPKSHTVFVPLQAIVTEYVEDETTISAAEALVARYGDLSLAAALSHPQTGCESCPKQTILVRETFKRLVREEATQAAKLLQQTDKTSVKLADGSTILRAVVDALCKDVIASVDNAWVYEDDGDIGYEGRILNPLEKWAFFYPQVGCPSKIGIPMVAARAPAYAAVLLTGGRYCGHVYIWPSFFRNGVINMIGIRASLGQLSKRYTSESVGDLLAKGVSAFLSQSDPFRYKLYDRKTETFPGQYAKVIGLVVQAPVGPMPEKLRGLGFRIMMGAYSRPDAALADKALLSKLGKEQNAPRQIPLMSPYLLDAYHKAVPGTDSQRVPPYELQLAEPNQKQGRGEAGLAVKVIWGVLIALAALAAGVAAIGFQGKTGPSPAFKTTSPRHQQGRRLAYNPERAV